MVEKKKKITEEKIEKVTQKVPPVDEKKVKEMQAKINKQMDMDLIEKALDNNQFTFEERGIHYRVRRPSYDEKQEANKLRMTKYVELLQDPGFVLEEDLFRIYKARGIDIEAMTTQYNQYESKKSSIMLKLGEYIKNKRSEKELELLKNEIGDIQKTQQEISVKKAALLECSIENQVMLQTYTYLTYLITEKQEGEEWIKCWDTYKEFLADKDGLVNKVTFYASLMIHDELNLGE